MLTSTDDEEDYVRLAGKVLLALLLVAITLLSRQAGERMRLTRTQVTAMINHPDSAFIKAMGFLYLRVGCLAAAHIHIRCLSSSAS